MMSTCLPETCRGLKYTYYIKRIVRQVGHLPETVLGCTVSKIYIYIYKSVSLSVLPSAQNSDPTRWIFIKFHISVFFSKICRENSIFTTILQEWRLFCFETSVQLRCHTAQFPLEWKIFQTKFKLKIETHTLCSIEFFIFFLRKLCPLWDNVENYGKAWQAADDSIIGRMHTACWITKAKNTQSGSVKLIAFPRHLW